MSSFRALALAAALAASPSLATAQADVDASVEDVGSSASGLQGRANAADSAACGCSVAGAPIESTSLGLVASALVLGAVVLRRRLG